MEKIYQTKLLYPEILWERPVHYYKSKAGKILIIAGSRGMAGAALLASEAAFRSGTGIITLAFPEELKSSFTDILPEAMTLSLPQTHSGSLSKQGKSLIFEQINSTDLVVIGPGISTNTETIQLVWELLQSIEKPIVLDADGLKALAYGIDAIRSKNGLRAVDEYFRKIKAKLILTPRPGEASKILYALGIKKDKTKLDYVEKNKETSAKIISEALGAIIILKGHHTVIVSDKRLIIDRVGGPELATAGSGDVLSGIIGSFLAQNPKKPLKAITTAVYLHSLAGRLAKEEIGERPLKASDTITFLPKAIKKAEEE